jgi:hypothetical protein
MFGATPLLALLSLVLRADALSPKQWHKRSDHLYLPKEVDDYKTATAPNNVTIRYKNPGICETTPGVESYSGYVDLTPDVCIVVLQYDCEVLVVNFGQGSCILLVLRISKRPSE